MNRALPSWAVDLAHDGLGSAALRGRGDRAVWAALRRVAMSAQIRGWPESEWTAYVLASSRKLGQQARIRRGKPRPDADLHKQLRVAWKSAAAYLELRPDVMAAAEVAGRGADRARCVLLAVADPDTRLTDPERAVLAHAASEIQRLQREGKQVDLAPLPRRTVAERTGLSERVARTAISDLTERGLLELAVRGRRGAPGALRPDGRPQAQASLYRLPATDTLARLLSVPVNGSVGHPAQISGTSAAEPLGTPAQISGTSARPDTTTSPEGPRMVTLTITAPDAEALSAALAALRREQDVAVQEIPDRGRHLRSVAKDEAS